MQLGHRKASPPVGHPGRLVRQTVKADARSFAAAVNRLANDGLVGQRPAIDAGLPDGHPDQRMPGLWLTEADWARFKAL